MLYGKFETSFLEVAAIATSYALRTFDGCSISESGRYSRYRLHPNAVVRGLYSMWGVNPSIVFIISFIPMDATRGDHMLGGLNSFLPPSDSVYLRIHSPSYPENMILGNVIYIMSVCIMVAGNATGLVNWATSAAVAVAAAAVDSAAAPAAAVAAAVVDSTAAPAAAVAAAPSAAVIPSVLPKDFTPCAASSPS
ncbi:hypothetical protein DOS86_00705 [Anaplasma marginale]|nr:hypothetical protein DOS86_00705 [Anaplasma marginale]